MKNRTLAFFSIFFLIVINSILTPPVGYSFSTPCLSIAAVIYWISSKNNSMNDYHFFLLGLLNDFFVGTPLGSTSIFYFLVKISIYYLENRLKKNAIITELCNFIFGVTVYYITTYIFIIIYFGNYPSMSYFLMSYLLTLFMSPLIYITLSWIESKNKQN